MSYSEMVSDQKYFDLGDARFAAFYREQMRKLNQEIKESKDSSEAVEKLNFHREKMEQFAHDFFQEE